MTLTTAIRAQLVGWVGLLALAVGPSAARAAFIIAPGYDLYATQGEASDQGVPYQGFEITTFNFGGSIGVRNVGATDTIIHRIDTATVPMAGQTSVIHVEMLRMDLMSTIQVGGHFLFLSLQSEHGGPLSTGQYDITFASDPGPPPPTQPNDGLFKIDSFFDVFTEIHLDSLNGPLLSQQHLQLTMPQQQWSHYPTDPGVLIGGVNGFLNGTDQTSDFFGIGPTIQADPTQGFNHTMSDNVDVPEPSTLMLAAVPALCALVYHRRRAARARISR